MRRLAAGVLLAGLLWPAQTRSEAQVPFVAAVLRRDGALIPIATFTGRKWDVTWPAESYDQLDIPITTAAIPDGWWGRTGPRLDWQLWSEGVPRAMVHVISPRVVATMCDGRVALATDYRAAGAPPETEQPYPKAGIAVSPPTAVARVEILDASSSEWRAIGPDLKKAFDEDEDSLAAAWTRANDPHPISRKERLETPVTIEAMYATDDGPGRVYYVEGSRKYDHSSDARAICAVAFDGAYFRRDAKGVHSLGGEVRVVPCDRRGLVYLLPFGAMRLNGRLFWLAQYAGWDLEQYAVLEFKRSDVEVAASAYGGRCPKVRG